MLEIRNLQKSYGNKIVLNNIDISLDKGLWALIGKNGSGKTTLLKCVLGIESYKGSIKILGKEVKEMKRSEIASLIGYVPQITSFDHPLTVREFIEIGCYYRKGNVDDALKVLNLDGDRKVNTLSGGEFQRALIARAIVGHPKILLLDEPSNHLDIKNTTELVKVLKAYSKNCLVLAVIHDLNLLRFFDGVIGLSEGNCKIYNRLQDIEFEKIFDVRIRVAYVDDEISIIPAT